MDNTNSQIRTNTNANKNFSHTFNFDACDNYFEIFGINKSFDLDLNLLNQRYFFMQSKFHPDVIKTTEEKSEGFSALSAQLNKAYSTLKDELQRAEYLLSLADILLEKDAVRKTIPQQELTKQFVDLEHFENINILEELEDFLSLKLKEKSQILTALSAAFLANDMNSATMSTIKLKYNKNLISKIKLKITSCK